VLRTIIATIVAAAALTACGASAAPISTPTPPPPPPPPETVIVPAPAPSQPVPLPPIAQVQESWTMPDLVGVRLQEAQDTIQELTDFAILIMTSHDATGAGRMQVSDRNWKVCTQNVPPGATITPETRIDFGAVKLDEAC
jgi:hypothetical protein